MAVAIDFSVESTRTVTTDPWTWTHTPSGTPRAIVVAAIHGVTATSHVTGVTYGGVAMTKIVDGKDTATEPGTADLWFLGENIPTGNQTVSADLDSATGDDIEFVSISFTADADCEVVDFAEVNENVANPSVTLQYAGRTCLAIGALYGGGAAPSSFTENANCFRVHDHDLGAFYAVVLRQTTPGTADFTIGGTASSDDVGFAALAISEVVNVTTLTPGAAVAKFVVPTPSVQPGAVTKTPSPAVAKFLVPTPTVQAGAVGVTPGAAVARFVVPTPAVSNGVTVTPTPAQARFVVPTPSLVLGTVTVTPGAAVARFQVPTPTIMAGGVTLSIGAAVTRFIVPTPALQIGGRTLSIGTALARWLVPTPTVVRGTVTLPITPTSARFIVPVVTLVAGAVQLAPTAAVALWRVPTPLVSGGQQQGVSPTPAVARWVVPTPAITASLLITFLRDVASADFKTNTGRTPFPGGA